MNSIKELWNAQADECNQWDELGLDEKIEFTIEQCASICDGIYAFSEQERECYSKCAEMIRKAKY